MIVDLQQSQARLSMLSISRCDHVLYNQVTDLSAAATVQESQDTCAQRPVPSSGGRPNTATKLGCRTSFMILQNPPTTLFRDLKYRQRPFHRDTFGRLWGAFDTHTHTHTYTYANAYTYTYTYANACTDTYLQTYAYTYTYTHTCT